MRLSSRFNHIPSSGPTALRDERHAIAREQDWRCAKCKARIEEEHTSNPPCIRYTTVVLALLKDRRRNHVAAYCCACAEKKDRELIKVIAQWIRRVSSGGRRQPCFVCGKYQRVTEKHHLIEVVELAWYIAEYQAYGKDGSDVYIPTAWLCPTHHTIWHVMQSGSVSHLLYKDLGKDELERYDELEKMIDQKEVMAMLRRFKAA